MSGGMVAHGRLIARAMALFERALEDKPCLVLPSDLRVRIRSEDRATYPGLHIVCGTIERDPDDDHAVVNPTVIVEVRSCSTEGTDRSDKLFAYRKLPSLRAYVLVSQEHRRVEVSHRDGRRWQLEDYGPGERFTLSSIGVELAIDDLFVDRLGPIVP